MKDFVESSFKNHSTWLTDEEYIKVLDNVVIGCTDIVVINPQKEVLLIRRNQKPFADYFIIGGRMPMGLKLQDTASYNLRGEVSLNINPDRFSFLNVYNYIWAERQQEPQDKGCHMLSVTMYCFISEEEMKQIKLDNNHSEYKWVSLSSVVPYPLSEIFSDIKRIL